ncbi:MAG: DedA family protein [Candidatus Peribacteria bacterium]|jgi:membrane protein DedA with SNARE-associated domain|nr:DedA family protein [Candidatus Peribacteria bacterium]
MDTLLTQIMNLPPSIIQTFGYIILFLATICEGIPPLGILVPGQNLVIAGGFFANIGLMSPLIAFIYIFIGAWIGELFAYAIGKKYGMGFLKKYGKYIKITDDVLESTEKILKKKLLGGMILSKFYGWTRGVFPFMAGVIRLPLPKIVLFTGISNMLWGAVFFLIGYCL